MTKLPHPDFTRKSDGSQSTSSISTSVSPVEESFEVGSVFVRLDLVNSGKLDFERQSGIVRPFISVEVQRHLISSA